MNFKQIETFRSVVLTGSMTLAAQKLHTSQPNVSRLIAKLESEVGFELFDRLPGRVRATKGGEALFREVERAFVGLDSLASSAAAIREVGVGTLRVAAAASISISVAPVAIRLFRERFPSVRIVLDTGESPVISNWVATQHCDVGFVTSVTDKPGVVATVLHTESAVCVIPAGHRLAKKQRIGPRDLDGERFISMPSGRSSRHAVDAAFPQDGRILALETPFAATVCRMVSEGLGVSLINPILTRTMKLPGIVAVPFRPEISIMSHLLRSQVAPRDAHATYFIQCMKAAFKSV